LKTRCSFLFVFFGLIFLVASDCLLGGASYLVLVATFSLAHSPTGEGFLYELKSRRSLLLEVLHAGVFCIYCFTALLYLHFAVSRVVVRDDSKQDQGTGFSGYVTLLNVVGLLPTSRCPWTMYRKTIGLKHKPVPHP
jgi:hypothetical protein